MANKGDRFLITSVVPGVLNQEVVFRGIQLGFEELPATALYDLTKNIEGHTVGSTLARSTLEEYGYVFPPDAP
jgi:hypothetical protein